MPYILSSRKSICFEKLDGSTIPLNITIQNTITQKFNIVFRQVNTILERDSDFAILYDELVDCLFPDSYDPDRAVEIIPRICSSIDNWAQKLGYTQYSYKAPKTVSQFKLHIDQEGYKMIMASSVRSKFFCAPMIVLRKDHMEMVRFIYSFICREMIESGVQFKLERIIDSVVLSVSARGLDSKSGLWTFLKTSKGIDPQNLALKERNLVLYNGLPTIAQGLNPVNWLVSIARTSANFAMKDKINESHIAFNAPIESTYENSADMLKVFVYEEITSNRKLMKLFSEFPFAKDMAKEYVYPITNWVASPFVSMVFNIANMNITHLINILLLNIFSYKFLSPEEDNWQIFDLLTYRATAKIPDTDTKSVRYPIITPMRGGTKSSTFTFRSLSDLVHSLVENLGFANSIYTNEQLEEMFKTAVKSLLAYNYFQHNGVRVVLDPVRLTNEYVNYIHGLLFGKYENAIEKAREFLRGAD